jgi:anti-anti-sigma factor
VADHGQREGGMVQMVVGELDGQVTKVDLAGRLDLAGVQEIETRFNLMAGTKRKVVVDLSEVSFLASLGVRMLLTGAKTVAGKGGRMVLLSPQPRVDAILQTTGIDQIVPVHRDIASATSGVTA